MHGGAASQVKAAARLRLLELVNPALAVLARSMKVNSKMPAAVALKAATEVLDRAGIATEESGDGGVKVTVIISKDDEAL